MEWESFSLQIPSLGSEGSVQIHGCRRGLVRGAGVAASLYTLRDRAGSVFGRVDGIEIYFKHPMKD